MKKTVKKREEERRKRKEKKRQGLSTVVVTLIVILVSLVAIGVIWVVVRNVIQRGAEQVSIGEFTLKAEIMNVELDSFSNDVSLSVKRSPGEGEFNKLSFIFSEGEKREVVTETVSLNELEEKEFNFYLNNLSVSNLTSISIIPVLEQDGRETIGNVLDEYKVSQANFFQSVLQMNFVSPTPAEASAQSSNSVYVNVSAYDANNYSAFIDWNRNLICWWNFENVNLNGIVPDSSTWGNNGVLINHLTNMTIAGARGRALDFDGINDSVVMSYNQNLNITNEITIETWFYHKSASSWNPVLSRDDGVKRVWIMRTVTPNNFSFSLWNRSSSVVTATKVFSSYVDNWHHAAAVYNGASVIIYIDGVPGAPVDLAGGIRDSDIALRIGQGSGTYPYWNGSIDELRIYNRALSPQEINASYNAGLYRLYKNFTNLASGSYTYKAWAIDSLGNIKATGQRSVTIL